MPLAFFCTLFFRHRKKSVSAPWDGQSQFAPESARHSPSGNLSAERAGGFPRGKQSTRPALPCAPLVVCLNSGSLTACGGCAHWARASLRSPLHPFGSPPKAIARPIGLQALPSRRSRRVRPPPKAGVCACGRTGYFPLAPLHPFGSPSEAIERPISLHALLPRRSRCDLPPHKNTGRFSPPVSKPFSFFLFPTPSA